jgi:hypothetical protein
MSGNPQAARAEQFVLENEYRATKLTVVRPAANLL